MGNPLPRNLLFTQAFELRLHKATSFAPLFKTWLLVTQHPSFQLENYIWVKP